MRSRWMICLFSSINLAPFFPQHPLFPRKILPPSKLYILFPTPIPTSNTSPITTSTPKMDLFHSIASIRAMTTFIGSIDFLDSQSSFNFTFGSKPTMFCLSQRGNNRCATENTDYNSGKLRVLRRRSISICKNGVL